MKARKAESIYERKIKESGKGSLKAMIEYGCFVFCVMSQAKLRQQTWEKVFAPGRTSLPPKCVFVRHVC